MPAAAREAAVPNGDYDVTVRVGDAGAYYDSVHRLRAEGQVLVAGFRPSPAVRLAAATARVRVTDGRRTPDAVGGTNTKLDAVVVRPAPAGG